MQSDYEANEEHKTQTRSLKTFIIQYKLSTKTTAFCFAPGPKGDQGSKGDKGQDGKSGVKYIRWGRTTCPSGADVVYKGKYRSMCRFAGLSILGELKE